MKRRRLVANDFSVSMVHVCSAHEFVVAGRGVCVRWCCSPLVVVFFRLGLRVGPPAGCFFQRLCVLRVCILV